MKNKDVKIYLGFIIVVFITYIIAWGQMYFMAKKYYNQAEDSYNNGNYIAALKGEKTPVFTTKGYTFKGGYQQTVDIFKSPWAFPKPPLYYDAEKKAEYVINDKITVKEGYDIYNKFFGLDNRYLGEVLIRVGDICASQKDFKEAEKAYNTAIEAFPYNKGVVESAKDRIIKIKDQQDKTKS